MQPACLACVCIKNVYIVTTRISYNYNLLARLYLFLTGHHILQLWNRFSSKPIAVLKSFQLKNISVPGIILTSAVIFSAFSVKLQRNSFARQSCSSILAMFVPFLSPSAEASREAVFVGLWLFPCLEKRTKTVRKKDIHPKGRLQLH